MLRERGFDWFRAFGANVSAAYAEVSEPSLQIVRNGSSAFATLVFRIGEASFVMDGNPGDLLRLHDALVRAQVR